MSLVGFDHVFRDAVERELAPGVAGKVVPLVVPTLLKIVSYLDQPAVRQKDHVIREHDEDEERNTQAARFARQTTVLARGWASGRAVG